MMTKADVVEEIRALLREPQIEVGAQAWKYTDTDFDPQIRSVLRFLRLVFPTVTGDMDGTGTFVFDPTDTEGLLIAYAVAERLLSGDMIRKAADGDLGVVFRSGPDSLDTSGVVALFQRTAVEYKARFQTVLAVALANSGSSDVLGVQGVVTDAGTTAAIV